MNFLGRLFNYNNVGKKIKGVAMAVFGIGLFASVFGSLGWMAELIKNDSPLWWLPFLTFLGGPFIAWIVSWFFYAYGECVEACDSRLRSAEGKLKEGFGSLFKYDCLGGKFRVVAELQFILGSLGAVATAIIWLKSVIDTGVGAWWLPLVLLVVGPFASWLFSWFTYGYADISDAASLKIGEEKQHPFSSFGHLTRFDNIANKIKCTAVVSFYILTAAALVGFVFFAISLFSGNAKMWWLPLLVAIVTIVIALISSWTLYAYGNIVSAASAKLGQAEAEPFAIGDMLREKHTGKKIKGFSVAFVVLYWLLSAVFVFTQQGSVWMSVLLLVLNLLCGLIAGWYFYGFGEIVQASDLKVRECTGGGCVLLNRENKGKKKTGLADLFDYGNVGKKIKWMAIVVFFLLVAGFLVGIGVMAVTLRSMGDIFLQNLWVIPILLVLLVFEAVIPFVNSTMLYAIGEIAEAGTAMLCDLPVETKVRAMGHIYCGKCWKEVYEETEKCPYCDSIL